MAPERVVVTCDPAYLLQDKVDMEDGRSLLQSLSILGGGKRLVAVSVVNEGFEEGRHYHKEIAAACDALVRDHHVRIVFVYAEIRQDDAYDVAAARKVQSLMQEEWTEIPPEFYDPALFAAILGNMDAIIAMRMHVVILAALTGKACVTIVREPKVTQILSELGIVACGSIDDVRADRIVADVTNRLAAGHTDAKELRERTRVLAARGQAAFLAHWSAARRSPESLEQRIRVCAVKAYFFAKAVYALCKCPFRGMKVLAGRIAHRQSLTQPSSCEPSL